MNEIKIGRMVMGVCQTNCYFLYREENMEENQSMEEGQSMGDGQSKKVIFVDPADMGGQIYRGLKSKGFQVAGILLTHGHFDHIMGAKELRELSGARIYAFEGEKELCEDSDKNISSQIGRPHTIVPDVYVKDGEVITLAGMSCRVIATPGHTVGGCCYYFEEAEFLISGDTLFQDSVGRTDFPTGSMGVLVRSIREKLFVLPEETKVYPGHGDSTAIGYEKRHNPFCQ